MFLSHLGISLPIFPAGLWDLNSGVWKQFSWLVRCCRRLFAAHVPIARGAVKQFTWNVLCQVLYSLYGRDQTGLLGAASSRSLTGCRDGAQPKVVRRLPAGCLSSWLVTQGCAKPWKGQLKKVPAFWADFPYGADPDCSIPHQDGVWVVWAHTCPFMWLAVLWMARIACGGQRGL